MTALRYHSRSIIYCMSCTCPYIYELNIERRKKMKGEKEQKEKEKQKGIKLHPPPTSTRFIVASFHLIAVTVEHACVVPVIPVIVVVVIMVIWIIDIIGVIGVIVSMYMYIKQVRQLIYRGVYPQQQQQRTSSSSSSPGLLQRQLQRPR